MEHLAEQYLDVRKHTEDICRPLQTEDYVVQPVVDVSPPKWHLGHTTWFFETFVLVPFFRGYQQFNTLYNFVFNSYYETIGARVIRTDRGNLSRPSVEDVYRYRRYVDEQMVLFLENEDIEQTVVDIIILGLHHEQQHQELLCTDIKYILGHNPLFPAYAEKAAVNELLQAGGFVTMKEGVYSIGFEGEGFCFDNELGRHKVYLNEFNIAKGLVTNGDYLEFIKDGGYQNFRYWHAEGWDWVNKQRIQAPLYWHYVDGKWLHYTLSGLQALNTAEAVCHISYYEAAAFAAWKGMRLPTEAEWEVAAEEFQWGKRWEWTSSAYLPYPGFIRAEGAVGEYNGKFMVNQMVLRGASIATPGGHSRKTYRNFFHAMHQWQFTGIRLAY
ncbi:ergothioneine biosynthesis protein EgtB [Filimonas zeae]|uniref:Ergothioneine biosynthesis protein EgtB n=1 Tax=Filimonas zeae TaxID=1737353 RepID=A0A917INS8_9BACT|nr:ergothioneine biosynthesis protein EgtB [Filimonas zeae]MDR6337724.1 ergothioneine biosynthesis protein EgtB [Filimonas zeae]GGH59958.1 ergothioneine biosynthesis protein EgtB [Filimonas zeae]